MTDQRRAPAGTFAGARRATAYREPAASQQPVSPQTEPPSVQPVSAPTTAAGTAEAPGRSAAPAEWGRKARLSRLTGGLLRFRPSPAELAWRDAVVTIRQATWTRAVNVLVANDKGGTGKTPAAVILAGILGDIRGGYVAAFELSESAGSLARRAEGHPIRGLAELLVSADNVRSAGSLGGYTAPQTSHADVIGSVDRRRSNLTAVDVLRVRKLLDIYYRITIADSGNNPGHEVWQTAARTTDAVVLPCTVSLDALAGVQGALDEIRALRGVDLYERSIVVLGHDGGPEDPAVATWVRQQLDQLGIPVVEVPYDRAIRVGGEISLGALSTASRRAWTLAAAGVVQALRAAPIDHDLVAELADELTKETNK